MLDESAKKQIVALAMAGNPYAEIGRRFGVTRERARQIAGLAGVQRRHPPRRVAGDANKVERIVELASRGLCVRLIANEVGCRDLAVSLALGRRGITPVKQGDIFGPDKRALAVDMVRAGATFGEAAEALRMTRNAVAGACHRAGLKSSEVRGRELEDA